MAQKTLLELTAPAGSYISIDGKLHETVHPDSLTTEERLEYIYLARKSNGFKEQVENLTDEKSLEEAKVKAKEINEARDRILTRMLKAPPDVLQKLTDNQKSMIVNAIFTQGAGSQGQETSSSSSNVDSSPASNASTAAIQ